MQGESAGLTLRDNILRQFKGILDKAEITDAHNCIYNRAALQFVKTNQSYINRDVAAKMIYELINVNAKTTNVMIYKMLTTCKITVFLLDRFKTDLKFLRTIILKIVDSHTEMNKLEQTKKRIFSGKVLLNISYDCKELIPQLTQDKEILGLAKELP